MRIVRLVPRTHMVMTYLLNFFMCRLMFRDIRVFLSDLILQFEYSKLKLSYLVLIVCWRKVVL